MSNMQQRRPHSTVVSIPNGNSSTVDELNSSSSTTTREQRRLQRRMAKERRTTQIISATGGGVKKLKRVKRRINKYSRKNKSSSLLNNPLYQAAFVSFSLFVLFGMTVYKMFHGSSSSSSDDGGGGGGGGGGGPNNGGFNWHTKKRVNSVTTEESSEEYNSDNAGGLLNKLRGAMHKNYIIPESMKRIGSKARWYADLRQVYDEQVLPKDDERSFTFVIEERTRKGEYVQSSNAYTLYDINNCPEYPPKNYPIQWPVLDVLNNWPTDDTTVPSEGIYQGICHFDYNTEYDKAMNYRKAELPFVMRNDPQVARTTERWLYPGYMEKLLMGNEDQMRRTEYSPNNHFMYWVDKRPRNERKEERKTLREARKEGNENVHAGFGRGDQLDMKQSIQQIEQLNELKNQLADARDYAKEHEDDDEAQEEVTRLQKLVNDAKEKKLNTFEHWLPPTENIRMTYLDWLKHANVTDDMLGPDNPHWYFRLIGCGAMDDGTEDGSCDKGSSEWLFDELTFFQPRQNNEKRSMYIVEPDHQKGIHCRFGMKGVIAENHFDLSRNAIALLGGQRRYILANPAQCLNMNLLPRGHPSARHSAVDWSNPDLVNFPTFANATVNEIVLQPGDVLYLPTNWFHYIVSLELNMQCNTRSGGERINREYVTECGF